MNKRQLGTEYENVAAEYLQSQGYEIIERKTRAPERRAERAYKGAGWT